MRNEVNLRRNILVAARVAWHELLGHANTYVIKKVEPRDTFDQLLYKMKKIFSDDRAPQNTLKIVRKTDNTKPWYQASNKYKKVYVRIEAFICPLQADERLEGPHIFGMFEEKPVPLAKLSLYVQAKHFYDDHAPTACRIFTEQVREKFGPLPGNAHYSGWPPTQALDNSAILRFYKKRNVKKLDDALADFVDWDNSATTWND